MPPRIAAPADAVGPDGPQAGVAMQSIGSTSWPNRHRHAFQRLAARLSAVSGEPTVLIVGPGAATRLMRPFLADAAAPRPGAGRFLTDLARFADQLLRRLPWVSLVSLEPAELRQVIGRPVRWTIVDRSQRVLRAVAEDLPDAAFHEIDIARQSIPVAADVVVAFNVVPRTDDPPAAMRHVAAAVRPGGYLLVDDRSAGRWLPGPPAFEKIDEKLYRRAPATPD